MKHNSLTMASIIAAVGASLCCIGPLTAVVLGLSTFGAAAAFEGLRPYFLGLTITLLAGAWYLAYRRGKTGACSEGACPPDSPARYGKLLLWIATGLVAFLAAFPYYSPLVWKAFAQRSSTLSPTPGPAQTFPATIATVSLDFEGLTCSGCAAAIQSSLSQTQGVLEARVSFEDSSGTVKYDSARVTPNQLIGIVAKTGYRAKLKS